LSITVVSEQPLFTVQLYHKKQGETRRKEKWGDSSSIGFSTKLNMNRHILYVPKQTTATQKQNNIVHNTGCGNFDTFGYHSFGNLQQNSTRWVTMFVAHSWFSLIIVFR